MGVQNLWVLLAPVGRQIEIESLAGQVLAVDASIWLTQFVKAMRDDEGNMIRNAHLLGTLHRVAKLLYYGVRPVFVFDGQTPEIKKRTTARRRKRQEQQSANLRHTAQRILLNRLKQHRQEMKKNGGAPAPAVAPGFTLPEASKKTDEEKETEEEEEKVEAEVAEAVEEEKKEEEEREQEEEKDGVQQVWEAAADQEGSADEDLTLDDIDLDTSRLSKIDLHAVFSLPPHLQKDMIQKILRDRRQEVRDQFIPLAGNPEKYSHTQIAAFLQTSALNRRIEAAKRQKREEEMQVQGGTGLGQGHRINSNSNRFYIYQKDTERKEEEKEEGQDVDEVVADIERHDMAERRSAIGSALVNQGEGKRHAGDAFSAMEKRPLSKFSSGKAGFVPDASATEVTAAWVARHQVRVKQEPMLAIEKLRLARLKKDEPHREAPSSPHKAPPTVAAKPPSASAVSVSLKLEDVDPKEIERFQKLFPASIADYVPAKVAISKDDDDDDDVDWEEVAAPATQPSSVSLPRESGGQQATRQVTVASSANATPSDVKVAGDGNAESDAEMDWEDVPTEAAPAKDAPADSPGPIVVDSSPRHAEEEKLEAYGGGFMVEEEEEVEKATGREEDEEGTDELFLTLKNEMEDAKAHEDLDLLKDEALQSAMATASNLTQWAAGAVRRALQAHSQLHGGRLGAYGSPGGTLRESMTTHTPPGKGTAEAPVEIPDEEEETKPSLPSASHAEVVVIEDEEETPSGGTALTEEEESREQLQAALAASIASEQEELEEKPAGSRVRYLQYSQPSESPRSSPKADTVVDAALEEVVDTAALQKEQLELKKLRSRQLRDTEGISDDMVAEVMALLRLFGVPFLVSPMEAEAQCAALEQLGLVDGVITDDSDIFPFGGQRVYKNIFHHQKFVEAFSARDIERELGFSREQIIALALLLGSDYTDGVRGIGIVNATEIAAAYPGIQGLREFKEWVREFDVAKEAERVASAGSKKKKKSKEKTSDEQDGDSEEASDSEDDETVRERFQRSHATARRKWELGDEFPSKQVVQAYMAPQVDRSEARFSWSAPDLSALRNYCANAFGWDQQKSDGVLLPLEEKAKKAATSGSRQIQTRLDRFFTSYDDQVHYAQIKSKRLRSAVSQRTGSKATKNKKQRK